MSLIVRQEIIHSDRFGAGPYVVGLTADGEAITCSCIHGRSGGRGKCYHRKRAEKALAFRRARTKLLRAGAFGGSREAFDARFHELAEETNVDEAIKRVLAAGAKLPDPCPRCGGRGSVPLRNGKHGECFRCKGAGHNN